LAIVRDVLGIAQANRIPRSHRGALLAPDRASAAHRRPLDIGHCARGGEPALDACRWAVWTSKRRRGAFRGDRIIEIAVVLLDGSVAFHSLSTPAFPRRRSFKDSRASCRRCCRGAVFGDIADKLLAALEGCVFVAHNARFDWAFVSTESSGRRPAAQDAGLTYAPRQRCPDLPGEISYGHYHFGLKLRRHQRDGDAGAAKCWEDVNWSRNGGCLRIWSFGGIGVRRLLRISNRRTAQPPPLMTTPALTWPVAVAMPRGGTQHWMAAHVRHRPESAVAASAPATSQCDHARAAVLSSSRRRLS